MPHGHDVDIRLRSASSRPAFGHRIAMTGAPTNGTAETYTYGYDVHGSVSQLLGETSTGTPKVQAAYGYRPYGAPIDAAGLVVTTTLIGGAGPLEVEEQQKTRASRRPIALDARTVEVLRGHRRTQELERATMGPEWDDPHGLVFTWETGRHLNPDWVYHEFRRLTDEAGLPRIRLHDLRHTHATLLLKAGVNPRVVSERLGHTSVGFTLDTYAHVLPGMQADAASRFADEVFGPADEETGGLRGSGDDDATTPGEDG